MLFAHANKAGRTEAAGRRRTDERLIEHIMPAPVYAAMQLKMVDELAGMLLIGQVAETQQSPALWAGLLRQIWLRGQDLNL